VTSRKGATRSAGRFGKGPMLSLIGTEPKHGSGERRILIWNRQPLERAVGGMTASATSPGTIPARNVEYAMKSLECEWRRERETPLRPLHQAISKVYIMLSSE